MKTDIETYRGYIIRQSGRKFKIINPANGWPAILMRFVSIEACRIAITATLIERRFYTAEEDAIVNPS